MGGSFALIVSLLIMSLVLGSIIQLMEKAARTSIPLLLLLPIVFVPKFFATAVAAEQSDTFPAESKRISRQFSTSLLPYAEGRQIAQQRKLPSKIHCFEHDENYFMLHQHSTNIRRGLQYQSRALTERSLSPSFPTISGLIWDQVGVISNVSAVTSYIYDHFYQTMTVVWANREHWVGPAVHALIVTCGAIKLTFQIVATERPVSMHILRDLVQDFARTMLHVIKSVVLASYRLVAISAFAILFVTLQIMQNSSPKDLITPPLV